MPAEQSCCPEFLEANSIVGRRQRPLRRPHLVYSSILPAHPGQRLAQALVHTEVVTGRTLAQSRSRRDKIQVALANRGGLLYRPVSNQTGELQYEPLPAEIAYQELDWARWLPADLPVLEAPHPTFALFHRSPRAAVAVLGLGSFLFVFTSKANSEERMLPQLMSINVVP